MHFSTINIERESQRFLCKTVTGIIKKPGYLRLQGQEISFELANIYFYINVRKFFVLSEQQLESHFVKSARD